MFNYEVHEEFLGFRAADGLTADSLSDAIQDELKQIGVSIHNLVGQGYDGAAVMSGKCSTGSLCTLFCSSPKPCDRSLNEK